MSPTLFDLLGVSPKANTLAESALVIVDAQREYVDGKIPLVGVSKSIDEIKALLERSRKVGTPVYFIRHSAGAGAPVFNPNSEYFQIVDELAPDSGEPIIDKNYPSSFAKTSLHESLEKAGIKNLIVTGFMTHACISTTVRAGAELGYAITVPASACATRDLPAAAGGVVKAEQLHSATMAALQDLFATIVPSAGDISDR